MKYNISKFNISSLDTQEPPITMYCYEKAEVMAQSSSDVSLDVIGTERISSISQISSATVVDVDYSEEVDIESRYIVMALVKMRTMHELGVGASIVETIYLDHKIVEAVRGSIYSSVNTRILENDFTEDFETSAFLGKQLPFQSTGVETLFINSNSTILDEELSQVMVNIGAGEVLRINSEDFTAFVDDINVLDKYNGQWIEIGRDTERISISSTSGQPIRGRIIYRERFL